jgi:5-formyltetrahydrofolate cyclo-ligase
MNKMDLRKKYKALRQQLSEPEIEDKSMAIANRLLQLDVWDNIYFHLFLTIDEQKEVDTEFILQILAGKDREIVVAKSKHYSLNSCSLARFS